MKRKRMHATSAVIGALVGVSNSDRSIILSAAPSKIIKINKKQIRIILTIIT